jgi:hypothetical protein
MRPDLFNVVIAGLNYGNTLEELSERLSQCVAASRDTGKASSLTLTLKIKPHRNGQYELTEKVAAKIPDPERGITLMFGTPDGNLVRDDPRQIQLDLRTVDDAPRTNLKEVV